MIVSAAVEGSATFVPETQQPGARGDFNSLLILMKEYSHGKVVRLAGQPSRGGLGWSGRRRSSLHHCGRLRSRGSPSLAVKTLSTLFSHIMQGQSYTRMLGWDDAAAPLTPRFSSISQLHPDEAPSRTVIASSLSIRFIGLRSGKEIRRVSERERERGRISTKFPPAKAPFSCQK